MVSLSYLTAKPAIKNSGQLQRSPLESFPLSLRHLRCGPTLLSVFLLHFPTLSPPYQYSAPYQGSLWSVSSKSSQPFLLALIFPTTSFPFPSSRLPIMLFLYARRSVIWPWLVNSLSYNGAEARCGCKIKIDFLSVLFFVFFGLQTGERASEKPVALLTWVMMLSTCLTSSLACFVACCDSVISNFGLLG